MTYAVPQALIFQDLQANPAALANPLQAHISGGHAQLVRFAQTDEQALGSLGLYDPDVTEYYSFPSLQAGGLIDQSYVKLWAKNAILQYFDDSSTCTKLSGFANRVTSASIVFATSDAADRSGVFFDRDVQLGDVVKVRAVVDSVTYLLWSYVQAILPVLTASSIGAATSDIDNDTDQSEGASVVQSVGPWNCVSASADGAGYDGLVSGDVNEVYTLIVTGGSTGGDLTTATLRVLSASGHDDQASVVPAASGDPTSIGTRGLLVTFTDNPGDCSLSASEEDAASDDLVVGQRFVVTVGQTFVEPVATSGGTYTGPANTSYKVTVAKGGHFGVSGPQITVSTTTGIDNGGPYTVVASATAVAIGSFGVTIKFSGSYLRAGDVYYIPATAQAAGPLRTLALGHNLDSHVLGGDAAEVTLFIPEPTLEISQDRTGFAPLLNWEINTEGTQLTVFDGIIAYDSSYTSDGVLMPLPLVSDVDQAYTELFVEYRAWLCDLAGQVNFISNEGDITAIAGTIDPDNPLAYGLFCALLNSNGSNVGFTGVCNPDDPDSWVACLNTIEARDDVYALAPLTRNATVQALFTGQVNDDSSPEAGLWREVFLPANAATTKMILSQADSSDSHVLLATVTQDPDVVGAAFTILQLTSANAHFQTVGVTPGDIVRCLFEGDGFGGTTYSEFVVAAINTQDEIRLVSGPDAAINVAAKFEIWRNLSLAQQAAAIATQSGTHSNRRVMSIWPDTIEIGGVTVDGMYACALLAGAVSGVVPQQGMTNVQLSGVTGVPHTLQFSKTQLDIMAASGTWIITQLADGNIVSRQAVTTAIGDGNINDQEEMVVRNLDSISFRFKATLAPFIGIANVTPGSASKLLAVGTSLITQLLSENFSDLLGGQIVSGHIVSVLPSATLRDRMVMEVNLGLPYPLNNIEGHLIVI